MKTQRQLQKEETRQKLLKASLELFSKNGILNTTTLDIAKGIGVSHGTFFLHFPTRDHLVVQIIDEFGTTLGDAFSTLAKESKGIKGFLKSHLEILRKHEPIYTQLVKEGPLLPGPIRQRLFMIQSGIAHYMEESAKYDEEKGVVKHFSISSLLNTWLGLVHYYLMHGDLFAPNESVLDKRGNELIDIFLNFINKGVNNDKEM